MKKIQIVDTFKKMRHSLVTVICMIVIVDLALSTFLGVAFGKVSMVNAGHNYYNEQNFHHFDVSYNYGITKDDIKELEKVEGIDKVEGLYKTTGFMSLDKEHRLVTVQSVTYNLDVAEVVKGKLPKKKNEIAIEKVMADDDKIAIGDTVKIDCENEDGSNYLLEEEFKVVGIVRHPAYTCNYPYGKRGISEKSNGNCLNYFLVDKSAFDHNELDNCYQSALLWSNDLKGINTFSDEYEDKSSSIQKRIEKIGAKQSKVRYEAVKSEANDEIKSAQKKLDKASSKLDNANDKLKNAENDLKEAEDNLNKAKKQYPNADFSRQNNEIADAKEEIQDKKDEYNSAKAEVKNKQNKLDEAKEDVEELVAIDWNVYERDGNASFSMFKANSVGLGKIAFSFALVYLIVALMVYYASINRMIKGQKYMIGTQKALGLSSREITMQYVLYSLLCTFLGGFMCLSAALGFVQSVSLSSYKTIYYFDNYEIASDKQLGILVAITSIVLTVIVTLIACKKVINTPTVELLKDKELGDGKEFFFEKWRIWNKISLLKRTSFKNLLNEKRHMITTIIGIAGTTALLVIGFTLQFAIDDVNTIQFKDINKYDLSLRIDDDKYVESFSKKLDKFKKLEYVKLSVESTGVEITKEDTVIADIICGDLKEINSFIQLDNYKTNKTIEKLSNGVLISANTANYHNIKENDKITIMKKNGEKVSVKIAGIMKNYVSHYIVMTPEYYKKVMGEETLNKQFFINLNGVKEDDLRAELCTLKGYERLSNKDNVIKIFENVANSLNSVIQQVLFLSAIMAFVVILNIFITYITEKSKTLAIMRINGYSISQIKAFVNSSNVALVILGLIFGIVIGVLVGTGIVINIETDTVAYSHAPNILACIRGCIISIVYVVIIGSIANRRIKKLPLVNINRFE